MIIFYLASLALIRNVKSELTNIADRKTEEVSLAFLPLNTIKFFTASKTADYQQANIRRLKIESFQLGESTPTENIRKAK